MKDVKAIVRPARLDRASDALCRLPGFPGMSVGKVEGCSRFPSGQNPRNPKEALTDFSTMAAATGSPASAAVPPAAGEAP